MPLFKSALSTLMFVVLGFSSLQASGEFDRYNHTQPEFPSYFMGAAVKNTVAKKETESTQPKQNTTIKIISISKDRQAQIKKAYKNYNVVASKTALTRKAAKSEVENAAQHYGATVVFFKPYVKNNKTYYSYYFLRKK